MGEVIDMVLDGSEYVNPDTKKWKITKISIPKKLSREEVLFELKQALMVYGCNGSPFNNLSAGEVVVDF